MVAEFLKYARPLEIPEECVGLEDVVERAITEVAQTMPQVTIECTGNFGDVAGDEGLLRQALLNLARNAAEACAEADGGGGGARSGGGDCLQGDRGPRRRGGGQ